MTDHNHITDGVTWVPDGEANFYTLLKGNKWFGKVQLNGELNTHTQESFLNSLIPRLQQQGMVIAAMPRHTPSLSALDTLEIIIKWLECNVEMGTDIFFDNDSDRTDSEKALPGMYEAVRQLRTQAQ